MIAPAAQAASTPSPAHGLSGRPARFVVAVTEGGLDAGYEVGAVELGTP